MNWEKLRNFIPPDPFFPCRKIPLKIVWAKSTPHTIRVNVTDATMPPYQTNWVKVLWLNYFRVKFKV